MAHRRLRTLAGAACILQVACGSAPAPTASAPVVAPRAQASAFGDAATGEFVSKRFGFRLVLPDGRAWRIDDHSESFLLAQHAQAAVTLRASRFDPSALSGAVTSSAICWSEAIARGVFTPPAAESPLEDDAHYDGSADSRILVSIGNRGESHVRYVVADRAGCTVLGVDSLRLEGDTDKTLADRLVILRQLVLPDLAPARRVTPQRQERPR